MSNKPVTIGTALADVVIPGLSAAEIARYSSVSGDDNPIHTDHALAKMMGLEDVPVQGMLVMALADDHLRNWPHFEEMQKLGIRFIAPALANRDIKMTAKVVALCEQGKTAVLRVLLFQAEKLVALGEAAVALKRT